MYKLKKKQSSYSPDDTKRAYFDRDSGIATTEAESDAEYSLKPSYIFSDDEDQPHMPSISLPVMERMPASINMLSSHNYYCNQADQAISSVRQHLKDKDWKKVLKHKSGVTVYMLQKQQQQQKNVKVALFKGESIIEGFTPQSVFYVIGMRKLWDEQFDEGNLIENLNETTSLTYESYKATATSKPYDSTLVEKIECSADGEIVFVCTSIETPQVPKQPGKNRMQIKLQGWMLQQLNTSPVSTKVTYVTQENINGWIPGLTKKSLARKPLVIASISSYLYKKADRIRSSQAKIPYHSTSTQSGFPDISFTTTVSNNTISNLSSTSKNTANESSSLKTNPTTNSMSSYESRRNLNAMVKNPPPRISSLEGNQSIDSLASYAAEDEAKEIHNPIPSSVNRSLLSLRSSPLSPIDETETIVFDVGKEEEKEKQSKSKPQTTTSKLYPRSRHRLARKKSLQMLQSYLESSLEEWKFVGEKNNTKMYSQPVKEYPLPILRGETIFQGDWTPEQVCSVIQSFGARKIWDEHFESGRIVERFSQKEYLVYMQTKSVFPIQSRDYSLLTSIDSDVSSGTIYIASTSVEDDLINEKTQHIRGKVVVLGWAIKPIRSGNRLIGVSATSIAHLQLGGVTPLPPAIVRTLTTQLPSLGSQVQSYLTTHGCPPYIRRVAGKVILEQFDHQEKIYRIHYIAKHTPSTRQYGNKKNEKMIESIWCTDIRTHPSMYSLGYHIKTPSSKGIRIDLRSDKMGFRIYTETEDMEGQTIQLQIKPTSGTAHKKPLFIWNDTVLLDFNCKPEEPIIAMEIKPKSTKRVADQQNATQAIKVRFFNWE
ncbi:hypothetical protein EDC96DRAFT_497045 [Choanephora cucurbitarum]|nr:hypothetical protein EDC96DRAFT_497045 [Choanephora cucurbitarum]